MVLVLVLTGCSAMPSAYDLPLPGGADLGDRPYRVTVEFDDVLDLVPHAGVKVDDVAVGKVSSASVLTARTTSTAEPGSGPEDQLLEQL